MIDLHTHSTFSDGTDTPEALVTKAVKSGLKAVALTDHDSTHGIPDFLAACDKHNFTGIAGVEISAEIETGTLHILGLRLDYAHKELNEHLDRVLDGRDWRNRQILTRLNELGLPLKWEEIAAAAGEDVVGRPHFAQVMLARRMVSSIKEAFDRYLAKGALAYVDRYRLLPKEGIRLINAAGGVAIIAHPYSWEPDYKALEEKLHDLRDAGLGGIEAYYSEHSPEQTIEYLRIAKRLGLIVTGGSDYHGIAKPGISLGYGRGNLSVPDTLLEPLLSR